jgi:septal ring factor EnvC (AmiA/AmiB activator)
VTNIIYAVELFAVYVAFDLRSLLHLGYVLDLCVICTQVYAETEGFVTEAKLLNFFHFWRFLRLYNVLVGVEREKSFVLEQEKARLTSKLREMNVEYESTKIEVEKQKEARLSVENLLQNYKDEVDTLNEALKIAAMDIAEVAQDDDSSHNPDDTYLSSGDEEILNDDSLRQLLTAFRMKANVDGEQASDGGLKKTDRLRNVLAVNEKVTAAQSQTSTILVHESGQYEVR